MPVETQAPPPDTSPTQRSGGPPDAPTRNGNRGRRRPWSWGRATPYLLVAPAVLFELLVHIIPMLTGIWMSFIKLTQFYIANWANAPAAGLDNYRVALDLSGPIGTSLLHSFLITSLYTVVVVGVSWVFGMSAALVLQRSFRGRGWLRTLFLVPYALPVYAGVITWSFMLQRDNGLLNHLLVDMLPVVGEPRFWLLGNEAFASMMVVAIWRSWPFAFLMIVAGMQSIPEEVYQAASVDGAGVWGQARHITLGMLRPVNAVLVLMLGLWTFNDFNTPFVLFGPTPPRSADIISIHIYNNSFVNWNFGLGAAMSVLLLLFLLLMTLVWLAWNRRGRRGA